MLKLLVKIVAGVCAVFLLVLGILAVALPRLVNQEGFRRELHKQAAAALGTPVEWSNVEAGVLPLRLIIRDPVLTAASDHREEARVSAASLELRLSVLALLGRRIQVDSLALRGAELVVTRTAEGFILPIDSNNDDDNNDAGEGDSLGSKGPEGASGEPQTPDPPEVDGGFELAIREILVEESRLIIHDRTLPRPLEWRFDALRLSARGTSVHEPLDVDFSSRLANGSRDIGGVSVVGQVSLDGVYDLEIEFDRVQLAEAQPYVSDATLSGALSGKVELEGAKEVVTNVETKLHVDQMRVATFGLDLDGSLDLAARQTLDEPIEFDAGLDLGTAGKVGIQGKMSLEGEVEADVDVSSLELAPFARLAGEEIGVSGRATGQVGLRASTLRGLSHLETDLQIVDAHYVDQALDVGGAVSLVLGLDGLGENDPVRFDIGIALAGGGHVDAEGVATLAGAIDAKLMIGNVDLEEVAAWVPEGTRVEGKLTGEADLRLTAEKRVERLTAKLKIPSARLVRDPVDVSGGFDLEVALTGSGPIDLKAGLLLDDGSGLEIEGTSTVEGVLNVDATLETFDLAVVRPFLPDPEMVLEGTATGSGRLVGEASAPEFLGLDIGIENGAFKTEEYEVEGPFLATVKVKEPFSRPRGRVDLDLTAARLRYRDQFTKKAGMRAEMTTRFVPEESGEIVFESKLKLRNIDEILLQGAIGETTSIAMTTTPFDLEGWSEVFPVLAEYDADGMVGFDGIGVELREGTPTRFGGRISMRGVGITVPEAGRFRVRGSILGEGTRVRTKGLRARVAGATIGVKAAIEDPLGEGRFDLELKTVGDVEVNDLLGELAGSGGIIFGLLDLKGSVAGVYGGESDVMDSLEGELEFTIGEKHGGTLRGVSILKTILDQVPLLGGAARLSSPFRGGKSVDDYFAQEFEIIEADIEVDEGRADARLLRLAYPGYEARLTGPLRLRDLEIDMTGEVLLKGDLVSALGGLAGADMDEREPIRIELARVTNTLNDPEIEMTSETLAAIPRLLFQATGLDTITLGIGKSVGNAIDRALGDGK